MRALVLALLVACQSGHDVRVLLGPTDDTLSLGFQCEDAMGELLMQRASTGGGNFAFAVVVDVITIGNKILGCRGEELITACEAGACAIDHRACHVVRLENVGSPADFLRQTKEELADFEVDDDPPDDPVVLRVVVVDLPAGHSGDACPADLSDLRTRALGCAHSCPVELDNVDEVSVSLDTLDRRCEGIVRVCAGFLETP